MDKRVPFFAAAAVVCFVLVPLAQAQYRSLTTGVGVVYLALALLAFLDHRSRSRPPGGDPSDRR